MRIVYCVGLCLLIFVGCARKKASEPFMPPPAVTPGNLQSASPEPSASGSKLIVTPDSQTHGQVALVNPNQRYLVVSFPVGSLPPVDRRLNVYRNGLKVAEIKITGPQRDFNIAADIVAGECQVGDEVREN